LQVVVERGERDGFSVFEVDGRLNLTSTDEFREVIARAIGEGRIRFIIDLQDAESVDSTGLGALVWAATNARRHGGELLIANPNEGVRMLLELTSTAKLLPLHRPA
jgi:anti-sigma B factor antagonist